MTAITKHQFRVTPQDGWGSPVWATDENDAVAAFVAERTKPQYCRCHNEIADRHSAAVGQMGYFTRPVPIGPFKVERQEEIVCCGAYVTRTVATVQIDAVAA